MMFAAVQVEAQAEGKKMWVQGSWVNVRQSAEANAKVIDHLSANTVVSLLAQKDNNCEVSWGASGHGYLACKFLGDQALQFVDVANEVSNNEGKKSYSPTRAFWVAPSMEGLFRAGKHFQESLLKPSQVELENGAVQDRPEPQRAPKIVRYPVPEFEAMKTVMSNGVVAPSIAFPPLFSCEQMQEMKRAQLKDASSQFTQKYSEWQVLDAYKYPYSYILVHDCRVPEIPQLRLPIVKASFFQDEKSVLRGSAPIEEISAKFGIVERGAVKGAPRWELDYDLYRYTGAWDIGAYQLTLEKPIYEHVVGRTGLVAAYRWTPQLDMVPYGPSGSCSEGLRNIRNGKELMAGYPKVKDALLWFQSPTPLNLKTAKVTSRIYQVKERLSKDGVFNAGIKRVVAYEVDLDNDGIVDFVQWDMWGEPEITGPSPLLTLRQVFINIKGVWYPFEQDSYGECT